MSLSPHPTGGTVATVRVPSAGLRQALP
jgi:hypothetical protein